MGLLTEKFEEDMAVFGFGQHQDFLVYYNLLSKFNYTFDDVEVYIQFKKDGFKGLPVGILNLSKNKVCPKCSQLMRLLATNVNKATQTGDDSKSVWLCFNKTCMETIYNKESVAEI